MKRALRRHLNVKKAIRKRKLSRELYHTDYYDNLHQYSDNKIHCSCGMCRFKPVYEPDQKTMSDIRKEEKMDYMEKEYLS